MNAWAGRALNNSECDVLEHLRKYPDLGGHNIAQGLRIPYGRVEDCLFNLFFHGLIEGRDIKWVGPSGYKRIWRVKGNGNQQAGTETRTVVSRKQP